MAFMLKGLLRNIIWIFNMLQSIILPDKYWQHYIHVLMDLHNIYFLCEWYVICALLKLLVLKNENKIYRKHCTVLLKGSLSPLKFNVKSFSTLFWSLMGTLQKGWLIKYVSFNPQTAITDNANNWSWLNGWPDIILFVEFLRMLYTKNRRFSNGSWT